MLLLVLLAGQAEAADTLVTVADVDLARYMGRWHQIALLPNRFQDFCVGDTTADYSLRDDGRVRDLSGRFYGLSTDYSQRQTIEQDAPQLEAWMREDGVDAAILVAL